MKKALLPIAALTLCSSLSAQIFVSGLNDSNSSYSNLTYSEPPAVADINTDPNWVIATDLAGSIYLEEGRSYDIIFLGEDAGFNQTDLYFIAGDGTTNYSQNLIFENIDNSSLSYGSYVTVSFLDVNGDGVIGGSFLFDFLLDSDEDQNITVSGATEGEFHLFNASADNPYDDGKGNAYANLTEQEPYLIFSFEDLDDNDYDYNDLFFAIKLTPVAAIPEPSTYGILGALLLLVTIARRRIKR